jgi:hypothetical protein
MRPALPWFSGRWSKSMINLGFDVGSFVKDVVAGGAGNLGGAAGVVGGVTNALDPLSSLVDGLGSALGLPPAVTNAAKIGIGAATGNPLMMAGGAAGMVQEVAKELPAVTEHFHGHVSAGIDHHGNGYCSAEVAGKYGSLGFNSENLVCNPYAYAPGFSFSQQTNLQFGGLQLQSSFQFNPFGKYGCATRPDACVPSGPAPAPPGGATPPVQKDSKDMEYLRALETLDHNWDALLAAGFFTGFNDNKELDLGELQVMANSHHNPEIRKAAQFLLDNPDLRYRLFNAHGDANNISHGEVKAEIFRINQQVKYGDIDGPGGPGESPPPVAGAPQPPSPKKPPPRVGGQAPGGISEIINNPSLSLEEKIMLILQQIMDDADKEVLATMDKLDKERSARAKEAAKDKPDQEAISSFDSAMEKTQMRLQNLMEKRKRMFDLQSTMSNKFHEMAKTAIQNLGRA